MIHEVELLLGAPPNNSFNPTALSVPLINLDSCDVACAVSSGGGWFWCER